MKADWQTVALSEVCTKVQDGAHRSPQVLFSEPGEGRFLYLTSKNIRTGYMKLDSVQYCDAEFHQEIYRRCNPEIGEILLTKDGANTGNVAINELDAPFSLLSSVCLLKPDQTKVTSGFLSYYLQSKEGFEQITGQMTGAAIKRIILKTIKSSRMPLPPLPEQNRIVAILDEAFAGIATAVANTEKNLANARELFESYLNAVFSQRGEGWKVKRIGEVAEHCLGKMLDKQKNKGTLRPYLRNINVRWFEVDTSDMLQMRIEDHEVSRYSVQKGDLLICEGGYPGRAALWERSEAAFFQKALHRVRCSDPRYNRWILYYLYFQDSVGELRKYFTGAGIQHLTGKALANLPIIWPPVSQLDDLLAGISGWQEEVTRLDGIYIQKLAALAELKKSLLQKAFSGELTTAPQEEIETALA